MKFCINCRCDLLGDEALFCSACGSVENPDDSVENPVQFDALENSHEASQDIGKTIEF